MFAWARRGNGGPIAFLASAKHATCRYLRQT